MKSSWVIKGSSMHILLKPWNWLPLRRMHLEPMRKIMPPQEPQNSPGQLPRNVKGDLGKVQHWILPILLPCPSLVSSLVLHVGCALLTWFRMSCNTWSHCWPGPMWFLGASSYRFLKFINSIPALFSFPRPFFSTLHLYHWPQKLFYLIQCPPNSPGPFLWCHHCPAYLINVALFSPLILFSFLKYSLNEFLPFNLEVLFVLLFPLTITVTLLFSLCIGFLRDLKFHPAL